MDVESVSSLDLKERAGQDYMTTICEYNYKNIRPKKVNDNFYIVKK